MNNKMPEYILRISENDQLEIKKGRQAFPLDAWESYSAFANTDGGIILLGFEELSETEYKLVGVRDPDKVINDFWNNIQNQTIVSRNILNNDSITIENKDGYSYISINVPRATYNQRPIFLKNNPFNSYKRIGRNDYKMSEDEVRIMMRDASPTPQDATVIDDVSYDKALDFITIAAYRQRFVLRFPDHPFNSLENIDFLLKLKAIEEKNGVLYPTLAGLLMFGKSSEITKQLPYFLMEYIDYRGNKDRWSDRVIYDGTWGEGNVFNFFTAVVPKLMKTADTGFSLNDDGVTRREYSDLQIALREAFVNSMIHADYRVEDRIQISCSDDGYVFSNPGSLRITIDEFYQGRTSKPRNPNLAFMFRMIGLAEEAGSGVVAMLKAAKNHQFPRPRIEVKNEKVKLSIRTTPLFESLVSQYSLTDREYAVLKVINDLTFAKRVDIENNTGLSRNIVLLTLNSLTEKGVIEQYGKSSATKYTIADKYINKKDKVITVLEQLITRLK